jgi:hypothetical protein
VYFLLLPTALCCWGGSVLDVVDTGVAGVFGIVGIWRQNKINKNNKLKIFFVYLAGNSDKLRLKSTKLLTAVWQSLLRSSVFYFGTHPA